MNRIPIPKQINIGGFTYTINLTERDTKELTDSDSWGEHSERQRTIRIRQGISEQQFSSTFLHEALHAINAVYSNMALVEPEINSITSGLLQVMEQMGVRFVEKE